MLRFIEVALAPEILEFNSTADGKLLLDRLRSRARASRLAFAASREAGEFSGRQGWQTASGKAADVALERARGRADLLSEELHHVSKSIGVLREMHERSELRRVFQFQSHLLEREVRLVREVPMCRLDFDLLENVHRCLRFERSMFAGLCSFARLPHATLDADDDFEDVEVEMPPEVPLAWKRLTGARTALFTALGNPSGCPGHEFLRTYEHASRCFREERRVGFEICEIDFDAPAPEQEALESQYRFCTYARDHAIRRLYRLLNDANRRLTML